MSEETSNSTTFRIVVSQLRILNVAGHNLLALLNELGQLCVEMEGLAISRHGVIKPIGYLPSDRLRFYSFHKPCLYRSDQAHACLIEGSRSDLENRINAARAAGALINQHNLPYPILGFGKNSNSVVSTLIRVMGLQEPLRLSHGAPFAPGQGKILLNDVTIARLQEEFHIAPISD